MRLSGTVLDQKAHVKHAQAVAVDIRQGGQNGAMTDFRGFVSNASYVRKNIICILIEAPRGFRDLGDEEVWVGTLKSLVELHPRTIEGLNMTLTAEFQDNPVGGAGEVQSDWSDSKRTPSTPTFGWVDKYGLVINQFFEAWITGLLGDPITKYPTVISNPDGQRPTDLLPDYRSATMLFIEPDPTHLNVQRAWLCCNMMPKTAGDAIGSRDLTQGGQFAEYSIEFTAMTQVGAGVNEFARKVLRSLDLNGMNPNLQKAFINDISADVQAQNVGYQFQMDTVSRSKIA